MKTTIKRSYQFSSAHWIPTLPEGHRCRNLHGHTYTVEVEVSGYDEVTGMVMDFKTLDALVATIVNSLDHTTLNNVISLDVPTVEVVSRYIFSALERLDLAVEAVTVQEGSGGSARTEG